MVCVLSLLAAVGDIMSLGAVLPFLGALVAPEQALATPFIATWAARFGIDNAPDLVFALTLLFVVAALGAGAIRLAGLWANTRFSFAVGVDLGVEMYRRTLHQPYTVHLSRNSAEVISGIYSKTSAVVDGIVGPCLALINSTVVTVAVVTTSLWIDSTVAILGAGGFGLSYVLVTLVSRRRLARYSVRMARERTELFRTLQEGLGGIRDVLLTGTQAVYWQSYARNDRALRSAQSAVTVISGSPRFVMEAAGMSLLALIAYGTIASRGLELSTAVPVLGALALAAQRLIPTLQKGYVAWTDIAGNRASLDDVLGLLAQPLPDDVGDPPPPPLVMTSGLTMRDVRFRYTPDGPAVLDQVSITVPRGASVGILGTTGAGKSTLVDLIMGLLEPTSGDILVDGEPIEGRRKRAWQQGIAHVPQSIFLIDATVSENIALGCPRETVDLDRVRRAAELAHIGEFIASQPEGYDAVVGERGARLSGGQRQRIGIARALYRDAPVLVLDEATSALDTETEASVMTSIRASRPDLTILMVAHRFTTLQDCDLILRVDRGRVDVLGSYDEVARQMTAESTGPD